MYQMLATILIEHPELDHQVGYECLWRAFQNTHDHSDTAIVELAKAYLMDHIKDLFKINRLDYEIVPKVNLP